MLSKMLGAQSGEIRRGTSQKASFIFHIFVIPFKYENSSRHYAVYHSVKPAVGLFSPMATFTVLDFIIILKSQLASSMLPVENGLLMAE